MYTYVDSNINKKKKKSKTISRNNSVCLRLLKRHVNRKKYTKLVSTTSFQKSLDRRTLKVNVAAT